jgi:hypothetical protein
VLLFLIAQGRYEQMMSLVELLRTLILILQSMILDYAERGLIG